MAYLATRTQFPSFERSRDFFRSGIGSSPQPKITGPAPTAPAAPRPETGGPLQYDTSRPETGGPLAYDPGPEYDVSGDIARPPTGGPLTYQTPPAPQAPPQQAQTQVPPAIQAAQPQAPPQAAPVNLGYQTQGSLEERLFQPVQQAAGVGQEQLAQFADLFRQQAGPSRTFEQAGGTAPLETAVMGGATDPARALLASQYTGPQGLDPEASGYLMDLAGRLRTRQEALGTGGGLATTIRQSAPGATGGEARFTARDILDPAYRQRLAAATAGVDPFAQRLESEITGAGEFAQQRAGEEESIARQAREYLGERKGGITEDIQSEIERQLGRQREARGIYGEALGAEGPRAMAEVLRRAQETGALGEGIDPSGFISPTFQKGEEAQALEKSIMAKPEYASLKDIPVGVRGPSGSGRGTLAYYTQDAQGNLTDIRETMSKSERKLFRKRQDELERQFDPLKSRGAETSALRPMQFGETFQSPEAAQYLEFDPGMRPSRGNVSTEEQRSQFNTINDLLGNLDRISEDENPFRAAVIGANIEQYLADEEEALEAQTGKVSQAAKEWHNQVKKMRKDYRKAKSKEKWGVVLDVVGGVTGLPIGHGTIGAEGTGVGSVLAGPQGLPPKYGPTIEGPGLAAGGAV